MRVDEETRKAGTIAVENAIVVDLEGSKNFEAYRSQWFARN